MAFSLNPKTNYIIGNCFVAPKRGLQCGGAYVFIP